MAKGKDMCDRLLAGLTGCAARCVCFSSRAPLRARGFLESGGGFLENPVTRRILGEPVLQKRLPPLLYVEGQTYEVAYLVGAEAEKA